ncbi:target of Nesh-SH3 isoform X2 [Ictalurus punctatus]|uniref:Target of Nesh-SH3 isoform X2 n=1 Tax=Ictalurus punctatus TaxID=7998 RepID=A0A2D0R6F5_ICTPU|nr:target of Nesh-SH3 isoform X2 [Ictalurus punctatus]
MSVFLLLLILGEVLLPNLTCASRVRRQTTKVRISAIGDTIMLKFLQPHMDTKLEGYILGYGSNMFSKQFIQLPDDGEPYETEIDAEPKYLVAVQPVKEEEVKKQCAGKETLERPLHLVIGSVTPTSVMLSWGTLLNTLSSETNLDDCIEDGHFTVRYREKEPKKKWNYQTCPTTETIIDRLKPDTPYEFGVRAESGNINGAWSPPIIHNTADDIDIHEPVKPENFPRPTKPVTESPQTFSPSMPLLSSVTQNRPASILRPPSPTQRVTQVKDISNHKTLKPENFLGSKKPITESPQAFSSSVPLLPRVTQSRPASLLRPPAPSPIPTVTLDIHKPLKPEIFLKPEKPITESPSAFSASVPFLSSETQSSLISDLRNPAPRPTQRVVQVTDIHKPLKPESVLRPKKPVTESPQTFSPSVPLLPRVTQSRPASLLRPPAPSPIPRVTLGTASDGIRTPRPSEDSVSLPQTLNSTHTTKSNLKTNNILQTHNSTISSLSSTSQQPLHATHSQLTTSKPLFNTPKTQTNTTTTVSSTVKAQLNLTQKKRTQLHNAIHPQLESSTSTFQLRMTQFQQHTTKYPLKTPQLYTVHPQTSINQSQHSTAKGLYKTTQNMFTTLEPITTQSQPHATQPQSVTSQSQPHTVYPQSNKKQSHTHATQPKPSATQSSPHTTQPQSIATQSQPHTTQFQTSTVKYYPRTAQPQPSTTQSQPHTSQPITIQSQPHTAQFQTSTVIHHPRTAQPQPSTTQSHPHTAQPQPMTIQSQPHTSQPQPITIQSQPHTTQLQTSTIKYHPRTAQPQPSTTQSQPHTSQPQHITIQSQPHTTQFQASTVKYHPRTAQPQPSTTRSPPHTSQTITIQSQPHTSQPQPITIQSQPHTSQPQPITIQSQPHTTQFQSSTVKYHPRTDQPQPSTTQSQPHTSQPITIESQPHRTQFQNSTVKHHPGTTKTQPTTTRSQPQPIKTQSNPNKHTEKSQPKTVQPKLTTTKSKPRKNKQKTRVPQSSTVQPQPTTNQSSTAKYHPTVRSHKQPVTNQHHKNIIKPKFTHEPNTYYQFSTTFEGLSTTEFQQKPDHHPSRATIKHSNTNTRQNGKTEHTVTSKPKQPVQTPLEQSNTQNSPWREKKLVNKTLPVSKMAPSQSLDGHLTKPALVSGATNRNQGQDMPSPSASVARTSAPTVTKRVSPVTVLNPISLPPTYSNTSVRTAPASHNEKHKGKLWDKPIKRPRKEPDLNEIKKQKNKVPKNGGKDKVVDLKVVDALPFQKPSDAPPTTELYQKPTPATTPFFAVNGSRYYMGDNSSVFSSVPVSEVDPMGKKRFVAPHVIYQIDKPPEQPCSVTHSLSFFPDEENGVANISGPPKTPPTNVTVVTVEGCPSFVIVDWEKTDNETTEYEVTSSVINPNGQVVSVVKTNQTHAAVENLKPESSYEFTVTPKNELGSGPSSEPVSFSTESADPRVREVQTGKNAIWSSFSFDADSYSECTGTQYVKRTWYRKFVGIQLCNSLRYKIYLSDSLKGKFYNIGDETGYGEDHCQFVDSFLDGRTGSLLPPHQLPLKQGYFRSIRQEPVKFGKIGGRTQINYVSWYECGVPIPGSW